MLFFQFQQATGFERQPTHGLGFSHSQHPFHGQPADVQYQPFTREDEEGFSLKLTQASHSNHHRLGYTRTKITNYQNQIYTGPIWVGGGEIKQEMQVVFDTGSDWLILETD